MKKLLQVLSILALTTSAMAIFHEGGAPSSAVDCSKTSYRDIAVDIFQNDRLFDSSKVTSEMIEVVVLSSYSFEHDRMISDERYCINNPHALLGLDDTVDEENGSRGLKCLSIGTELAHLVYKKCEKYLQRELLGTGI